MTTNQPERIEMKLVDSNCLMRVPCDVCGGCTEKVYTWCEGYDPVHDLKLRVCESCLEADDIDGRLYQHALRLEQRAAFARSLVGRLVVPTWAEWEAAEKKANDDLWDALDAADQEHIAANV